MRDRNFRGPAKAADEMFNINEQIRAREVRLVGVDGKQIGVVSIEEALRLAEEEEVDLVEVAPEGQPPVCRLLDYGKLKYREQKKAAEARKHSATQQIKELRIRYSTDQHDLETKIRNARKFLTEGDKVKFSMRFRGRENEYRVLGEEIFNQIVQILAEDAIVEQRTPMIGHTMSVTFAPKVA